MNSITAVSQITYSDLADYIRLDEVTTDDQNTLTTLLSAAKSYIVGYTGLTMAELDDFPEFVDAVFVLVQDMWDNRALYVDKSNINKVVETILGLHAVNLLPTAED